MLSNCSQCQYFQPHPHHSGDVVCAADPAYASMWQRLNSLDQYTLDSIPVDSCREFELHPSFQKQEISLSLTLQQWQAIANSSDIPCLLEQLEAHDIKPTFGDWIEVDSSCIKAIAFDESSNCLKIRFHSTFHSINNSVYQYSGFNRLKFSDFRNASSLGRFFHDEIKDFYPCSKLS